MIATAKPKTFPLGQIVATPAALEIIQESGQQPHEFIYRHQNCDWGDVCPEDWEMNDHALECGDRLLSSYTTRRESRIWIITEADRSSTTLLMPDEY